MNGIRLNGSFLGKLSTLAAVPLLLLSQHASAVGTTAGTDVDNKATVTYEVSPGVTTVVESAPLGGNSITGVGNGEDTTFVVDNRVDFSMVQVGGVHTTITAGATDQFVQFLITNVGNSVQDFDLVATELDNPEAVFGLADTDANIGASLRIRVGPGGIVPPPLTPPTTGSDAWVDELEEGESAMIYVFANDPGGLVDGDVMNFDLTATVAEGGAVGTPGTPITADDRAIADMSDTVNIVFSDGAGGLGTGTATDRHGFIYQGAGLNVTKVATVISDPFNGTSNPKAIPGAIVEYTVTVVNNGSVSADAISIVDDIDADIPAGTNFILGFYPGGNDVSVVNGGGAPLACAADGDATDGCTLSGQILTVAGSTTPAAPINIAPGGGAAGTLVIQYRVSIP